MMKLAVLWGAKCLVALPAALVLGLSLVMAEDTRGQMAPGEPLILIADDASAFAAAIGAGSPRPPVAFSADIVVVVPAPPVGANLILIDLGAKRKLWAPIGLQRLREIFSAMGEPA